MPKVFTSKNQQKGELGEKIVVKHLENKGFSIIETNFTCTFGEIDIIATMNKTHYFIEVKSVSSETLKKHNWKPEQNFHQKKLEKMLKTVNLYKYQNREVKNIELLLATVILNSETKKASVSLGKIQ